MWCVACCCNDTKDAFDVTLLRSDPNQFEFMAVLDLLGKRLLACNEQLIEMIVLG